MPWWIWTLIGVYVVGFIAFLVFHLMMLQMVTPGLALLRSAVWPIFWATGWPHGVPLTMD
jgi:hypothetical protein